MPTLDELLALLDRLRQAQRELIFSAAKSTAGPADGTVKKIADLESTILAVEHTLEEFNEKPRQDQPRRVMPGNAS
jgi:hypothetical protein